MSETSFPPTTSRIMEWVRFHEVEFHRKLRDFEDLLTEEGVRCFDFSREAQWMWGTFNGAGYCEITTETFRHAVAKRWDGQVTTTRASSKIETMNLGDKALGKTGARLNFSHKWGRLQTRNNKLFADLVYGQVNKRLPKVVVDLEENERDYYPFVSPIPPNGSTPVHEDPALQPVSYLVDGIVSMVRKPKKSLVKGLTSHINGLVNIWL